VRFLAEGPDIPDELLVARDEGKVLFFCGSGVSIARAHLPGFLGLANRVMEELRALPDSAPQQLTALAGKLMDQKVPGVSGIVAADRIFGSLERDFALVDIERAVGTVLKPKPSADTTAHRVLLELSRTANGNVQLVTTNFDLLFEAAAPKLRTWTPNDLPDLGRGSFDGVAHLHGMFDPGYRKAVGGNLVLSSAEFGRAYLSEGWATRFIRDASAKYTVVFVGYTADDPPVQYLLEALSRDIGQQRQSMYAFQAGLKEEAASLWAHKGVTAISYEDREHHAALWQTLARWAERARDPEAWRAKLLRRALTGPEALTPHERGQVMHLAMTPDGVKTIVTTTRKLPASWLMVFDPVERYETPERRTFTAEAAVYDAFQDYGLDSDPPPKPDESGGAFRQREIPVGAFTALTANTFDPPSVGRGSITGEKAVAFRDLPPRLLALTAWISGVAEQPFAIWWALNKPLLHPVLLQSIESRFRGAHDRMPDEARAVWRSILEARRPSFRSPFQNIYTLQDRMTQEGWSRVTRRDLIALLRPSLQVSRAFAKRPIKNLARARLFGILTVNLKYQDEVTTTTIPDSEVATVTPMVRRLLEEVSVQEAEISPFTLDRIPPIQFDPRLVGRTYEREHGFNRLVFWYIGLIQRLLAIDPIGARREFDAWLVQVNTLFQRLRVWACSLPDFLPAELATQTLATLNDKAFWSERGQRDLLISLKSRWDAFTPALRAHIEKRLLTGLPHFKGLSREQWREWKAHDILERVLWLQREGCAFMSPVEAAITKARAAAPRWKDQFAAQAADSQEGHGGVVSTNLTFDHVENVPINELLARCIAESGRDHSSLSERDPLGGLVEKRPTKVLRALLLDGLPDDRARLWAWSNFLQTISRREDSARRTSLIGYRLAALPEEVFAAIVRPISYWLEGHAETLYRTAPAIVGTLSDRIISALSLTSAVTEDNGKRSTDWLNRAVSSAAGQLVEALCHDPILVAGEADAGLPVDWKTSVERLLSLPNDEGLFALYQTSRRLSWLYSCDRAWTEANILVALASEDDRREVVLNAFLHSQHCNDKTLYEKMKAPIQALISGEIPKPKADARALSLFTMWGWLRNDGDGRWLSDVEMRTALVRGSQAFRTMTLWQVDQLSFPEKKEFLARVWPLQLAARSPTITDRLCHIAFKDPEHFAEIAEIVIPFLTPIRRGAFMFATGVVDANALMAANADISLELYWRILPEDSAEWPYDSHRGLEYLHKHVKALHTDPRMIELMRRRRKGYF
jgi:hypothetical protein